MKEVPTHFHKEVLMQRYIVALFQRHLTNKYLLDGLNNQQTKYLANINVHNTHLLDVVYIKKAVTLCVLKIKSLVLIYEITLR